VTKFSIVSMAISNDSTVAITITKAEEYEYWIKMYNLDTKQLVFEEAIGSDPS
jgi:hypothetical protein